MIHLLISLASILAGGPFELSAQMANAHAPTTTHTAETTNNTAACSEPNYGLNGIPYCGEAFSGFTDQSSTSGPAVPLTQPHNPPVSGAWNIAKGRGTSWGDVHSLLYPANTTMVLAETQFWWCFGEDTALSNPTVTVDGQLLYRNQNCPIDGRGRVPWSSHLVIGYDSNDPNKTDAIADDLWDRGFDGAVGDWAGDSNTCKSGTAPYANNAAFTSPCEAPVLNTDQSYQKFLNSIAARRPGLSFAFMYDEAAYKFTQCNTRDLFQPQCIQNKIFADSSVLISNWFTSPNYLTVNGQPVLMFFVAENAINFSQCAGNDASGNPIQCHLTGDYTCHGAACWSALWDGVRSYFQLNGANPYLIFENNPNHEQADGNFTWVQPSGAGTETTADVQNNWGTQTYLDHQLSGAATMIASNATGGNGLRKTYFAGSWRGFDDRMASWSPSWANGAPVPADVTAPHYPRTTSQRCGNNWLDTFEEAGKYFNSSLQLPFMMVGTWDDYEEGTEIETGIDNCVSGLSVSLKGDTLRWTIAFTPPGSERSVDHYTIYYSTDGIQGEQLRELTSVPVDATRNGSYSLDLRQLHAELRGETVLYVKAFGKPSLASHMSAGVTRRR